MELGDPRKAKHHSDRRTAAERGKHAGADAENSNGSRKSQQQRRQVDRRPDRNVQRAQRQGTFDDPPEQGMEREPDRKVEDHADDSGGDSGQRSRERVPAAKPFKKRRAEEDPEKAGDERHPGREDRSKRCGEQRVERSSLKAASTR